MTEKKKVTRKRARTTKGKFKADNPKTPFTNEAYEKIYTFRDYLIATVILVGLITVFVLPKL